MEHKNNFNIIRLIFASTVIISHSYPLTQNPEIISLITDNQLNLGALSVDIFFIISGYLIYKSLQNSKSLINYIWKRILRLYPALIIMLIFSILIILIVNKSPNITQQDDFQSYFLNNLKLYDIQHTINGVFESNPYPRAINGSLWSLCYETTMYLIIIPLLLIKNRKFSLFTLITLFIIFGYLHIFNANYKDEYFNQFYLSSCLFYELGTYFIAGCILTYINIKPLIQSKYYNYILISLLALFTVSIFFHFNRYINIFILPTIIIFIGLACNKKTWKLTNKIGDLSYGIYIYGFLIQQTLMNYYQFSPILLMIFSLLITSVLAFFSWHIIEKKALQFKNLN